MRRAIGLLLVMCILGVSVGLWMEKNLRETCCRYLDETDSLRGLVEADRLDEALDAHAYLYAHWQGEVKRLNAMVSHHHTRAVDDALLKLTTALEHDWQDEALQLLDDLSFALNDLESDMTLRWDNIL